MWKHLIAGALLTLGTHGFASDEAPLSPDIALDTGPAIEALDADELDHHGACKEVKLDETQKGQLKEAIYAFKKERIKTKAELKLAALEYGKVLADSKSEKASAETAAAAVTKGITTLATSGTAFVNDIFFRILKADQREAGVMCLKAVMHHRHGRHHHGHGHHGRFLREMPLIP